jgi:hypothetical protein
MSRTSSAFAAALILVWLTSSARSPGPSWVRQGHHTATFTVKNPIDVARPGETIVLAFSEIQRALPVDDVRKVHVSIPGVQEVLAQPIDVNDDGTFEQLLFQADFGARQARTFTLTAGERQVYTREQFRAYGRFVRERRDDFAWENDRIAHRMYGAALETWPQEPLTSSAVDVWVKRTRRLVVNDWYMVDDYHRDHGEGADLYSAGKSRGCGGSAVWEGGRLYPSANFRGSRVLANGPLRVMFELTYEPWDVNGKPVAETKRITLDAGQNLDRFETIYTAPAGLPAQHAIGIKKQPGSVASPDPQQGILGTWEPIKEAGNLGCAVIVDPSSVVGFPEAEGNYLVVARVPSGGPVVYYAGFGWDKSGDFAGKADWDVYVEQFAQRLRAPMEITMAAR